MKENKGRFPWKEGARFETLDSAGHIWQHEKKPTASRGFWWAPCGGQCWYVGVFKLTYDYTTTLIERYPSEQSETAPFTFGPEHIGKRVRHVDGSKGIVLAVEPSRNVSDQLVIKLNVGESVQFPCYSLEGKVFASDKDAVIFLDESETAPAETDQTPDLQAKVKELERFSLGVISDNIKIRASIEKAEARVEVLEAEVKELRESREMVHRFVPARTYLDDMRFVVPGAKSDVGVLSFTGCTDTPAEPDPTEPESDNIVSWIRVEGLISAMSESINTKLHYLLARITGDLSFVMPKDAADVHKVEPDPTAQKIEALKLLFPWLDGCEFMTVDAKFGMIWQWGNEPVNDSKTWASKGGDANARRVGHIPDIDPELCKILIKRTDGE